MFYTFGALGVGWTFIWLMCYTEVVSTTGDDQIPLVTPKVSCKNVHWSRFVTLWPLWAIYIAHFSMNWTNYIVSCTCTRTFLDYFSAPH